MVRPYDYGDQNPSDTGDTQPTNPVDGLTQRSYSVNTDTTTVDIVQYRSQFDPVQPPTKQKSIAKTVWLGTIGPKLSGGDEEGSRATYQISREDGEIIEASVTQDSNSDFEFGTDVLIVPTLTDPDSYTIIGSPKHIKENTYWASLTGELLPFSIASAKLQVWSSSTLSWTTTNTIVKLKNNSPHKWESGETVQVRRLDDTGDVRAEMYFEPISPGGPGAVLTQFELIQEKTSSTTAVNARRVLTNGSLDTSSIIIVIDNSGRFAGYPARGTAPNNDRGYRGYAEFLINDYNGSGNDGYLIIEMEQPTLGFLGSFGLKAGTSDPRIWQMDIDSYDALPQQGEGRDPEAIFNPSSGQLEAHDLRNITEKLDETINHELEIIWSEDIRKYVVVSVNTNVPEVGYGLISSTLPAGSFDYGAIEATPGKATSAVFIMDWNSDGTKLVSRKQDDPTTTGSSQIPLEVDGYNLSPTDYRATTDEPIMVLGLIEIILGKTRFTVFDKDFRSLPGFAKGIASNVDDAQIPWHEPGKADFKLDAEECPPPTPGA